MGSSLCCSAVFGVQYWGSFLCLPEAMHSLLAEWQAQYAKGLAPKETALLCFVRGKASVRLLLARYRLVVPGLGGCSARTY